MTSPINNRSASSNFDARLTPEESSSTEESFSSNFEKNLALKKLLIPLTLPYRDSQGYTIQLWKYKNGLVASIEDENGKLTILSGNSIRNALQPQEPACDLLARLEKAELRKWGFAYLKEKQTVHLWPHLVAAGKDSDGVPIPFSESRSKIGHVFSGEEGHFSVDTKGNRDIIQEATVSRENFMGTASSGNDWYLKNRPDGTQAWAEVREGKIVNGGLNRDPAKWVPFPHDPSRGKIVRKDCLLKARVISTTLVKEIAVASSRAHQAHGRPVEAIGRERAQGSSQTLEGRAQKAIYHPIHSFIKTLFYETLQQNRLTASYNSGSPGHPVPDRGATGGSIGGVGNQVGIISGLFDGLDSMEEDLHYFYMPSVDGEMPFSNEDLQQILRELAAGIFLHDTVPFFSLHFNADSNMYPVIHPAYQNTLVGKTIGLLDYYMKGFLNGAFFDEVFIEEWQKTKTQDPEVLKSRCIDLHRYCQEHLGLEFSYLSIPETIKNLEKQTAELAARARELGEADFAAYVQRLEQENPLLARLAKTATLQESAILSDYSGFRSSFRIIAKQNSIKKADNLFLLDGDFDVFYTIEPDPVYEEELAKYRYQFGHDPAGYTRLVVAYELMQQQIKANMPRLPKFRALFEQLKVINFFSYYFKTLKEAQKAPFFDRLPSRSSTACPPLFPHLPVRKMLEKAVEINMSQIFQGLTEQEQSLVSSYIQQQEVEQDPPDQIVEAMLSSFLKHLESIVPFQLSGNSRNVHKLSIVNYLKKAPVGLKEGVRQARETLPLLKQQEIRLQQLIETQRKRIAEGEALIQNRRASIFFKEHELDGLRKWVDHCSSVPLAAYDGDSWSTANIGTFLVRGLQTVGKALNTGPNITRINELEPQVKPVRDDIARILSVMQSITQDLEYNMGVLRGLQEEIRRMETFLSSPVKNYHEKNTKSFTEIGFIIQSYTEVPEDELNKNKRVVGGCGLNLENKPVVFEPRGMGILDQVFPDLLKLDDECLQAVKLDSSSQVNGYVFKIHFSDFAISRDKDYEWMPFLLAQTEQQEAQYQAQVFASIDQGDQASFYQALSRLDSRQDIRDCNGVSLAHYAATAASSFYLEELFHRQFCLSTTDPNGYTPLHYAAKEGRVKNIEFLLSVHAGMLGQTAYNNATALYLAVQHNQKLAANLLLSRGANPNARTAHGMTPLYCAIHHGLEEMALGLLQSNAVDIELAIEDGTTPFYLAVEMEMIQVALALITRGADINRARKDSLAPLHIAAKKGTGSMCQLLLAQPGIKINAQLKSGRTAFHLAAEHNDAEIARFFLIPGIDLECRGWDQETVLLAAIRSGNTLAARYVIEYHARTRTMGRPIDLFNHADIRRITPMRGALKGRHYDVVEALLPFTQLFTPSSSPQIGVIKEFEFIIELCKAHADPLFIRQFIDRHRFTEQELQKAFLTAAAHGHNQMVSTFQAVYKVKDLYRYYDEIGWGLIHYAAKYDHVNVIEEFLKIAPQNLLQLTKDRKSIAVIAAENGSCRVLKLVLDALGEALLDRQYQGEILLGAVKQGKQKAVDLFIHKILDPNIQVDEKKRIAAHHAVISGSVEMLELLRTRGARFDIPDELGLTSFHYAFYYQWEDVIEYFLDPKYGFILPENLLYYAAGESSPSSVEKLCDKVSSLDAISTASEETPVFNAIRKGNYLAFVILCKKGANLNVQSRDGDTPFLLAARLGRIEFIPDLISRDLSDQMTPRGENALCIAAKEGQEECVEYLLAQGFDPTKGPNLDEIRQYPNIQLLLEGQSAVLAQLKKRAIAALQRCNMEAFFSLIKNFSLNKPMVFEIGEEKQTLPLLHVIYHVVPSERVKMEAIRRYTQIEGVNKNVQCPKGQTIFHLMAFAGQDIAWDEVDLLAQDQQGVSILHLYASKGTPAQVSKAIASAKTADIEDRAGLTPLCYAIGAEKIENTEVLLKSGANPSHRLPPLHIAVRKQNPSLVRLLLEYQANIDQADPRNGETGLLRAISMELIDMARLFIESGADVRKADIRGRAPIHEAAKQGSFLLLRLLQARGASLKAVDNNGVTVMHYAGLSKNPILLNYLSIAGASLYQASHVLAPSIRSSHQQADGLTPLHMSAAKGHLQMVQRLVALGSDVEAMAEGQGILFFAALSGNKAVLKYFQDYRVWEKDSQRIQAIKKVIARDSVSSLKLFYQAGTSVEQPLDLQGSTAFHLAASFGSLRCAHYLMQRGADPKRAKSNGKTPFEMAIANHQLAMVRYLSQTDKIDLHVKTKKGGFYLHSACEAEDVEIAALLLELGLFIDAVNPEGLTALHIAAKKGHYRLVHLLLAVGADPSKETPGKKRALDLIPAGARSLRGLIEKYQVARGKMPATGGSFLHMSFQLHDMAYFPLLLKIAEPDHQNREGLTVLHLAVLSKKLTTVRHCLKHGASLEVANNKNRTPLYSAALSVKHLQLTRFLLRAGAIAAVEDSEGVTLLYALAKSKSIEKTPALFDEVLSYLPRAVLDKPSEKMLTALKNDDLKVFFQCVNQGHPVGNEKFSLLHLAVDAGSTSIVECLSQWFKMEFAGKDANGRSFLDYSMTHPVKEEIEVFLLRQELIQKYRGSMSKDPTETTSSLRIAVSIEEFQYLPQLLKTEDINQRDSEGISLLDSAILEQKPTAVCAILQHAVDLEATNPQGRTPLHLAAFVVKNFEIARLLLNAKAKLAPAGGNSFLHMLTEQEDASYAHRLLDELVLPILEDAKSSRELPSKQMAAAIKADDVSAFLGCLSQGHPLETPTFSLPLLAEENNSSDIKACLLNWFKVDGKRGHCKVLSTVPMKTAEEGPSSSMKEAV